MFLSALCWREFETRTQKNFGSATVVTCDRGHGEFLQRGREISTWRKKPEEWGQNRRLEDDKGDEIVVAIKQAV